jgi:hypothetical protein
MIAALFILGGAVLLGAPELSGSFVGRQVFPPTNWWNLDVSHAPLDPASASFLSFIGRTRQVHPDFGPPPYGIPYVVVTGDQPLVIPTWTAYGDESDSGAPGRPPGYPIPPEARTTANYIEGGVIGGGTSGDRHMLIVDEDNWLLYETGATRWNAVANRGKPTAGWSSISIAAIAAPRPGRLRPQPGSRSFRAWSVTTKHSGPERLPTPSA